jgi:hypothetical protein
MGQVGDGAMLDLALVAIGLAQQGAGIRFAIAVNGGDINVHSGYYHSHIRIDSQDHIMQYLVDTNYAIACVTP